MIGPHERELHALAIFGAKESLLQSFLHVLHAAVPIPVEQEDVDPVVSGKVDFASRPLGIAFVEVAPRGLQRLVVPGKPRNCGLHALPLRPAFAFPGAAVVVRVPVRIIHAHDGWPTLGDILGRTRGRRIGQDRPACRQADNAALGTIQEFATSDLFHR